MSELKTSDILRRLALGELSNLTLVDSKNAPDKIKDKYVPAVLMQLNKAMRDVFTKFLLVQKEIVVNTSSTITHYYLRNEFAASNAKSTQDPKYLDDSACDRFEDGLVKILEVYDGMGRQLFLNRMDEPLSVFTPQFDCLQITANHQSETFYVIFQALHQQLTMPYGDGDNAGDDDVIVAIPPSLEDPLLLLVASKVYGALNGQANTNRALQYEQKYEMALLDIGIRDTASTSENIPNSKLDRAGFV